MRILSAADVRSAISMRQAIQAVREGFIALSTGQVNVPLRGVMHTPEGVTLTMPASLGAISTVKVVSVYSGNIGRGLNTIHAAVLVLDSETGAIRALLEGAALTAIRTGAASGLATELLARPDSTVLGVIGAGVQSRTQIEAVCAVRPIREIRIYSRSGADQLADELRARYQAAVIVCRSERDALGIADVIVAATDSRLPVVHLENVLPGTHINGIGSFTPQMQEIDAEIVRRAKLVVDHRESAWAEAGDLIIPRDAGLITQEAVHAELGEIAAGRAPGRVTPDEITLFKSVGNAVQDIVVAARILESAVAQGLGAEFDL